MMLSFQWSLLFLLFPCPRLVVTMLAYLNDAVVSMVFTLPFISIPYSPCINTLMTVPSAPITIGITVTFMLHSFFFNFLVWARYLSLFLLLFRYYPGVSLNGKVHYSADFLFCWPSLVLVDIRWFICISKSQRFVYVLLSRTDPG